MKIESKYENEKEIAEMTLLLMSLTSWREKARGEWSAPRAWKGYDFDILNNLAEQDFISPTLLIPPPISSNWFHLSP